MQLQRMPPQVDYMGTIGAALMPGRVLGLKAYTWGLAVRAELQGDPKSHFRWWAVLTDNEAQFWK